MSPSCGCSHEASGTARFPGTAKRSRHGYTLEVRILLSSFEPFGEHDVNASREVARHIAESAAGLLTVELPVVRHQAARRLIDAVERERPDAVLMLGIAGKRAEITPERVAINVDDYRIPDNAGNQPVDEPVVDGAPAAYFSTLPIKAIVAALADAEIPTSVSNAAGTYLCNHVAYSLLHHLERTSTPCRAGFLHIPQMTEAGKDDAPSLPFETLVLGVRITLDVLNAELKKGPFVLKGR